MASTREMTKAAARKGGASAKKIADPSDVNLPVQETPRDVPGIPEHDATAQDEVLATESTDDRRKKFAMSEVAPAVKPDAETITPTGMAEAGSRFATATTRTRQAPQIQGSVPAELQLAMYVTSKQVHEQGKSNKVSFAAPDSLLDRIAALDLNISDDTRLGPHMRTINRGTLATEAARRFAANPGNYPVPNEEEHTRHPIFHAFVYRDVWSDMQRAWKRMPEGRSRYVGRHMALVLDEVLTELEALYPDS